MRKIDIRIQIQHYSFEELPETDRALVNKAMEATYNAYADYSNFYVGAALRLKDNTIVIGANQENAAFPSGLCAERSAIFAAQSQYPQQPITTLAVAARNTNGFLEQPITPCGACRQVILEIEDRYQSPIRILLYGKNGVYQINTVKDLLPLSFVDANMR